MVARRVKIVADTRELRSGILDRLRAHPEIDLRVRPHKVGDYWLDDALVVERKSLRDFYGSIFDGRLFRQLRTLRRASTRCLLLVEGLPRSPAFKASPPWLQGALLKVTAGYQVPWLPTKNRRHTAEVLYRLALQQVAEPMGEPRFRKARWYLSDRRRIRHAVLQAVPKVGPKRASALLNAFESLGSIFTASPKALAEVQHVGPHVAELLSALGGCDA